MAHPGVGEMKHILATKAGKMIQSWQPGMAYFDPIKTN